MLVVAVGASWIVVAFSAWLRCQTVEPLGDSVWVERRVDCHMLAMVFARSGGQGGALRVESVVTRCLLSW
jgi:hypothetical protein